MQTPNQIAVSRAGKSHCLATVLALTSSIGCVSIQSPPTRTTTVNMATFEAVSSPDSLGEVCPLYDRKEVAKQWASRLNPLQLVPTRVSNWVACHHGHCIEWRHGIHSWVERKRDQANEPPWPRFHPLPTKPAFEPEKDVGIPALVPDAYGTFSREQ